MQIAWILCAIFGVTTVLALWKLSVNSQRLPAVATTGNGGKESVKSFANADGKSDALKAELTAAKEEIARKNKQLEEAREEAKKKLRREGKKMEREAEEKAAGPDPREVEILGLKKGMAALESQLNNAKAEAQRATTELDRTRGDAKTETDGASRARDDERTKNRSLADDNVALKRTLDELRNSKRKENERPDVPGTSLDLKALPADAVQELARFFRKGEEYERLYNVAAGQLQLEKDRYQEVQRRYFAVCRELALAAGTRPQNDTDAKTTAEAVVAGSDEIARGTAPALNADGTKKKRRRRRRRKPGQGDLPGVAAGAADAEGAQGDDDGEEGDDGDEHDGDVDETVHTAQTLPPGGVPPSSVAPAG